MMTSLLLTAQIPIHSSISSGNISGIMSEDIAKHFTISCNDFKKLYDAIHVLDIGNQVSEKSINQTTLDGVENIFNTVCWKLF